MIVLIVGDFGVGKDTVADLLLKESLRYHDCERFVKILSYATREPRYDGEKTHTFCSVEEFLKFNDLIASTQIEDHYYGTRASQFDTNKVNLYCVDDKGVKDVIEADIDDILVVEVIRPKWLIDLPEDRLKRKRHNDPYPYPVDYRVMNDGDMYKLEASTLECFNFIIKEVKKTL